MGHTGRVRLDRPFIRRWQGVEAILIPTANGYPAGINVLATVIVPARALENNAYAAYVNWVQVRAQPEGIGLVSGKTLACAAGQRDVS